VAFFNLQIMKKLSLLLLSLTIGFGNLNAQPLEKPNFAAGSHPVTIDKITKTDTSFVVQITLENRLPNGYFCAGKKIVLIDLITGAETQMKYAEGVPVCPEMYHFKWVGEKLQFSLHFPALDTTIRYADLIEVCKENCLVINGLILDPKMNLLINTGYDAYTHKNLSLAMESFQSAITRYPDYPYGFVYGNIIRILLEENKTKEAKNWAQKLKDSPIKDKYSILRQLHEEKGFSIK